MLKKLQGFMLALEDLSALPALIDVPEGYNGPSGEWAGLYKVYWCIAYNTKLQ